MTTTPPTQPAAAESTTSFRWSADAHVRRPRIRTWASGLLGVLLLATHLAPLRAAEADAAVKLRQAATARAKWVAEETAANGQAFTRATQAAADAFTKIELKPPSGGTEQFVRVTLNQHGTGFDGIRFTVPKGEARDLVWAFACLPRNVPSNWYILARTGEMPGFRQFFRGGPGMKGVPWEESVIPYEVYVQPLAGGVLQPEQEYLIWFQFYDARPKDLYVMVKLVPVGTTINSVAAVHSQLGLSYRPATK